MIKYGIQTGKQNADPTAMFEAIKRAGFEAVLVSLSGKFDNDTPLCQSAEGRFLFSRYSWIPASCRFPSQR